MSDFRARRPASPPSSAQPYGKLSSAPSQRFPPRPKDRLDADERKALATSGYPRQHHPLGGFKLSSGEVKLLILVVVLAAFVRLYKLSEPNSVVFDEVHFGKFASKYIKTRYYVDVHPPLAKLLITLVSVISGYDGNFDFKDIGKIYADVPYVMMRALPAVMGLAVVPLTYLTLRGLDCRATTALLGSVLVAFENSLITQSRLILLDSPLIFFTSLSTFCWVGFSNEDKAEPFTEQWWFWLTLTGLSLGAVVSCKWVGLFTIALVGLCTIRQLWLLLGDMRVPPRLFVKHFCARALCLIVLPITFYMAMFEIHFLILQNSGEGDGFMSSEFQHTLQGRGMADTFADVAIGSEVTLRHVNTQGGYLHSHPHNYPGGSQQQQITLYPHRDDNNNWIIRNALEEKNTSSTDLVYLTPGMTVRFDHISTNKRLHSHDVRPPISEVDFQNEVSGYGFEGFEGDANDNWIVEIESGDRKDPESKKRLRTLRTYFRLRHPLTGCYLFSHKVKLPEWGFEQQEVTCNKNAVKPNSLWVIETNSHPNLPPDAEKVNYRIPGFLAKFLELQRVMWDTNAGLTDRHVYDSRPLSWPFLKRGINFWVKDHRQIYLLGNPFIWWSGTAAVLAYAAVRGFLVIRAQRGYKDFLNTGVVKADQLCGFLFLGWALHYLPFFLMERQLFLHHYLPALYFSILLLAGVFEVVTGALRPRVRLQIAGAIAVVAILTFAYFSPLAYGSSWTRSKCMRAQWVKSWDFSCHDFYESYSQYDTSSLAHQAGITSHAQAGPQHITTDSIINPIEPGRDVFKDGPHADKSLTAEQESPAMESQTASVIPPNDTNKAEGDIVFIPKQPGDLKTTEREAPPVEKEADTPMGEGHVAGVETEPEVDEEERARKALFPEEDAKTAGPEAS